MLVLGRHIDEQVVISDNIIITVVSISGDKVRLGFDAPIDVPIHRREVFEAIQREQRAQPDAAPIRTRRDARRGPGGRV